MKMRRKEMNKLSVSMKLVSPAFMGGADPKKAELRTASLRGLLHFWWRATQPPMDPSKLLEKENALFGSTKTGQSKFLARVVEDKVTPLPVGKVVRNSIGYLGYGITEYDRNARGVKTTRDALDAGSQFTLRLLFKKGHEENKQGLLDALWCLTYLGGMGSRSRRGFGSAVVTELEGAKFPTLPHSVEELKQQIEEKFQELRLRDRNGLPEYTALSALTKVRVLPLNTKSWENALQDVGDRLNAYRSAQKTERFHDDRDLILDYAYRGKKPNRAPRRAAFGLPHNYFFKQEPTKKVDVIGVERNRRASPLFIHLHELRGGQLAAVLSFIPARFLPKGEQVKIGPAIEKKGQREREVENDTFAPPPPDFGAVEGFLSSLGEALEVNS